MSSMKKITESTVSNSTTNTVTISNIPNVGSHLYIVAYGATTRNGGDSAYVLLNDDTSNYSYNFVYYQHFSSTFSNTVTRSSNTSKLWTIGLPTDATSTGTVFGAYAMMIPAFGSSLNPKVGYIDSGNADSSKSSSGYSANVNMGSFTFASASPISKITFVAEDSASVYWKQGSKFMIYALE